MAAQQPARRWMSVDDWCNQREAERDRQLLARALVRPVQPASDEECYELNPPMPSALTASRRPRKEPRT
jgi:hypothetical protein